jgi:hypothetical protein
MALQAAKARGVKLGNPNGIKNLEAYRAEFGNEAAKLGARQKANEFAGDLRSYLSGLVAQGLPDASIAAQMNEKGLPTPREGGKWHRTSVRRLRARLAI